MQGGHIIKRGPSWFLKYREPVIEDGQRAWRHRCVRLAPIDRKYRTAKSVELLARQHLDRVNSSRPEASQRVSDYIEKVYLPNAKLRPSTKSNYGYTYTKRIQKRLGDIRISEFRTLTGENLLRDLAEETNLSHASLLKTKTFLSAVFKDARRRGVIDTPNPMRDVSVPEGAPGRGTHACSLEEVQRLLAALPEPSRSVVAVAAFSGLRRSELMGLRWEDYTGDELRVVRTVWGSHIEIKTKTPASRAAVPVVPFLQKVLEDHRQRMGGPRTGFIFAGPKLGHPLDLHNLVNRQILPVLKRNKIHWFGLHSLRRGLATNLYRLGVPDKTIQAILRHSSVVTTLSAYVKSVPADSHAAMQRLEKALADQQKSANTTPSRDRTLQLCGTNAEQPPLRVS